MACFYTVLLFYQVEHYYYFGFRAILTQAVTLNELQILIDATHFLWITNLVVSELETELEEVNKSYASFYFFSFFIPESDPELCIKYRIKKAKLEKSDKIQSEKKEKQDSSKDDVCLSLTSNDCCLC